MFDRFKRTEKPYSQRVEEAAGGSAGAGIGEGTAMGDTSGVSPTGASASMDDADFAKSGIASELSKMSDEELEKHVEAAMQNLKGRNFTDEEIEEVEKQLKDAEENAQGEGEIIDATVTEVVDEKETETVEPVEEEEKQEKKQE